MGERLNPFNCDGESVSSREKIEAAVFMVRWSFPFLGVGTGVMLNNPEVVKISSLVMVTNLIYGAGRIIGPIVIDRFHR